MKKIFFTSTLSIFTILSFSQNKIEYANFIQTDTAIKWAAIYNAYINLTPVNPNFNIGNYFFNNIKKSTILNYHTSNTDFSVTPEPYTYKEMISRMKFEKYNEEQMTIKSDYDEKSYSSLALLTREQNDCDTCFTNKLSFIKIKQLLYYKNGKFKIRNILLNPLVYKKMKDTYIDSTYFSETINVAYDEVASEMGDIPKTAIFISRANNTYNLGLNSAPGNTILTLNNYSLGSILYRDIMNKKISAYNSDSSLYPSKRFILNTNKIDSYHNPLVEIFIYDTMGEQTGTKLVSSEINYDSLYTFKIVQDFYFDFNAEKMYSKLIAFIPQKSVVTESGIYLGMRDHWGVIFEENKRNPISKKK